MMPRHTITPYYGMCCFDELPETFRVTVPVLRDHLARVGLEAEGSGMVPFATQNGRLYYQTGAGCVQAGKIPHQEMIKHTEHEIV